MNKIIQIDNSIKGLIIINILATQYTLKNRALEIYIAGCSGSPHCIGCHNPDSWDFNQGELYNISYRDKIIYKLCDFDSLIDNIQIYGGEPLDNNHDDLCKLLIDLYNTNKIIWLFTRYNIEDVPAFVKEYCHYIKCGRYIPELITEDNIQYGIKLATSNQKIYKIKEQIINETNSTIQ